MLERINQVNGEIALSKSQNVSVNKVLLHEGWHFRQEGSEEWLEAQVPGCNFIDLLSNRKINDPFFGDNEAHLQWIEEKNWEYKCVFKLEEDFPDSTEIELVFEGLDTYSEVFLNGHKVVESNNMFIEYRTLCKEHLRRGDNELFIKFRSPILETQGLQKRLGTVYPAENDKSDHKLSVFTRKAPYHYGWDWGPKFVTSGIWKSVYLQPVNKAKISNVHITQAWQSDTQVKLSFELEIFAFEQINGELFIDSDQVSKKVSLERTFEAGMNRVSLSLTLSNPERWWPNGLGKAYLYNFAIRLMIDNSLISKAHQRIGLRTIEVINEPDNYGESFYIKVNGHPVFMKGANYIPSDSFLPNVSKRKYDQLFDDIKQSNMNMIRVWGGGIYEDDYFYELADEYGILIWQDFMFACTLYPGTDEFIDNVKNEATNTIKRLRNHACLALWCGNNEIEMGIEFWEWKDKFGYSDKQYEGLKADYQFLFHTVLPQLVTTLDTNRFYFSSSPIGFWEIASDDRKGDNHYWGVWHGEEDFDSYKKRVPRFMSEYGFQSFPLQQSVNKFIAKEDQRIDSAAMKMHQKHPRGNRIINETILKYYKAPQNFESFLYLSQLVQAEGLKIAFEAHRNAKPFCMGSLYWQLNDCWPVASWSGMDYYGKWKALHYQVKRSFSTFLVTGEMENERASFFVISDSLTEQAALLKLVWKGINGQTISEKQLELNIAPNVSELTLNEDVGTLSSEPFCCVMTLEVGGEQVSRNILYTKKIGDVELPKPDISCKLWETDGVVSLKLMSSTFVKNLYVEIDGIEGNFSDNFFDLIPYENTTIQYKLRKGDKLGELSFLSVYDTYNKCQ
ncbi:glycoside hydrolase family 2 protein [Fulvivirga sp. M361]|uniref:beta-mannosidase n=1 Tax=Fulvivirga sp. M361 TaxID=2594266 RepID=UPI00117BB270|nr:glycoside hydrolase family 2 protein [Fulvivirga sp. M361]TRX53367.1 glycoside hydrolase family 2 protein [Fulvivirga sp. M361]